MMRLIHVLIIYLFLALSPYRHVDGEAYSKKKDTATSTARDTVSNNKKDSYDASKKTSVTQKSSSTESLTAAGTVATGKAKATATKDKSHLDVIQLTSQNFGKHISDGGIWLIEFYSPHCIHCVEFAPSYEDIARHYHGQRPPPPPQKQLPSTTSKTQKKSKKKRRDVKVGKINGEIERALVSRFAIHSYPCFFLIDGWNVYKFDESRQKKTLIAFTDGGYKKYQSISFYASPMGPLGIFQGTLMSTGHIFYDVFQWSQETFGLSALLVGMILFGIMFLGSFFLIVSLALIIPDKPKRD
jgi:thiol-disulfide isomerase/thioredoxin